MTSSDNNRPDDLLGMLAEHFTRHRLNATTDQSAEIARLRAALEGWQPIETAPKDEHILLWVVDPRGNYAIRGRWQEDRYTPKGPRPYWTTDDERIVGKVERRSRQPTHWMPLPPAPPAALNTKDADR